MTVIPAVVAKVLLDRHPSATLIAELHEMPATMLSVEQQIRLGVLGLLFGADGASYEGGDPLQFAQDAATLAEPLVAYVQTGMWPQQPAGASE